MNGTIRVIDADTHVDESDATWAAITDDAHRPVAASFDDPRAPRDFWSIDGYKVHKAKRDDALTKTTKAQRELADVGARLAHMDDLGVEVQVIYPTIFNRNPAATPELELELTRSYNRWIASRTETSGGRLRWVCVLPYHDIEAAVAEVRFAKDHGACGVLKKGDREADHLVWEDWFFPVYDEAQRLDLPICFHQGTARVVLAEATGATPENDFLDQKAPAINGVASLLARDVPRQFPTLRFGCIEVGASWAPLVAHMYRRRVANRAARDGRPVEALGDVFAANRIYAACEVDEDFTGLLRAMSIDNLLVGSDYGHNDPSQEHWFVTKLLALAETGELPADGARKILWDNPRRFYGL